MSTAKVLTGSPNIFYNSSRLFVEYDDIIRMPQFMLLCGLDPYDLRALNQVIDFSEIAGYSSEGLLEWYFMREDKNLYMNFPFYEMEGEGKKIFCEKLLEMHLGASDVFYRDEGRLSFFNVLQEIMRYKELLHDVVIYNDYYSPYLEEDVRANFPGARCVFGNIEHALMECPNDSTFVFSNIENIQVLYDIGKLEYSSIILANRYRYNFTKEGQPKIDFETFAEGVPYKLHYFEPTILE